MKIICVSGKAEAGKTTSAKVIKTILDKKGYRVLITNYAGILKFVCSNFFGWDGQKNEEGRALLQWVGTDVVRKQDPDYWVNFMRSIFRLFPDEWDYVLIDDVRFKNEIEGLIEEGLDITTLRVERPFYENHLTEEQRMHPSETELDDYQFDYVIQNPGDIHIRDILAEYVEIMLG